MNKSRLVPAAGAIAVGSVRTIISEAFSSLSKQTDVIAEVNPEELGLHLIDLY